MSTLITNSWNKAKTSRLEGQHSLIYKASSWEAAYSHHPQIVSSQGKLFATWSLGNLHEDCPGQRMVFSTSEDQGATWTEPAVLVASSPGEHAHSCITSMGILVTGDTLSAFYTSYELTLQGLIKFAEFGANSRGIPGLRCLQEVYTGGMVSEDQGLTWKGPMTTISGLIANLSPVRISTGRLIFPAFKMFPYTDDPQGLSNWKIVPLPDLPEGYYDGAYGAMPFKNNWSHLGICEGSVYEPPDGGLRMMLRTSHGRLAVAESRDHGESWSEPRLTEFTDCGCRFQFGQLPGGRYFALSCPDPAIPESCLRRTPLVLAVSDDGNRFDRHYILGDEPDRPLRYPGAYKHGRYGYPYLHVTGDDLYVINSIGKEDIEIRRFSLGEIA
jgi:hypothetical protein